MAGGWPGLGLTCLTAGLRVVYPPPVVQEPLPIIDHLCVGGGLRLAPGSAVETWEIPSVAWLRACVVPCPPAWTPPWMSGKTWCTAS